MYRVEFPITYLPTIEKEFLPSPKFQGIYWQDFLESKKIEDQKIVIDGRVSTIDVVGFQGSEGHGLVQMHQEPIQQEDVFFISGSGQMTIWNGFDCVRRPEDRNYWEHSLRGVMNVLEAGKAAYVLAVASGIKSRHEKLILNITSPGGDNFVIEPVSTRVGMHHTTRLDTPSLYFVVKHSSYRPDNLPDIHELVGYTGPYGGGQ